MSSLSYTQAFQCKFAKHSSSNSINSNSYYKCVVCVELCMTLQTNTYDVLLFTLCVVTQDEFIHPVDQHVKYY